MSKPHILIVDDEPNLRRILQVAFEKAGYAVSVAESGPEALERCTANKPAVVLSDVTMPGMSGYDLQRELQGRFPDVPVIIMTAFGTIPQAIQAIRDGAYEYVTKPFDLDSLKRVVASSLSGEHGKPVKRRVASTPDKPSFIARSKAMLELLETVDQVADSRATVLISGESGVGKEVVAKLLHRQSSRAQNRFVAVSCAALPESLLESELFGYEKGAFTGANGAKEGRFELAHEGTLFLDEIGEVPPSIQVKLLRVLQEREFERLGANKPTRVDVRLVTATNRDLQEEVDRGSFRLDLMYRLKVVELIIPPLRDRVEDIAPLAEFFLEKYAKDNGRDTLAVADSALDAMLKYPWPGNVRELENAMERAVVLAKPTQTELNAELLPTNLRKAA